ncbi:MAG: T9SS type A sorting domain-containing protein [Ignavibacteriales bacterium]|nr:T9SS type A sorting domain-containing protein [Ignavibacteriales bacterium]
MISFRHIVPFVVLTIILSTPGTAQVLDSVGTGFTKTLVLYENPDPNNRDRVAQQILGGLDLNENGKKEFLYVTDNTFSGGRDGGARGYSLFLYEYDPATSKYKNIWYYSIEDTVGGSFPNFCVCDLDGDKHMEVALGMNYDAGYPRAGANPSRLLIFEFGPGALPTEPIAAWSFDNPNLLGNTRPNALIAGDVDGDGQQELGIAFRAWSGSAKGVVIASLQGAEYGPFTSFDKEVYDTTTVTASIYGTARITDLDNDGKKEFCFGYAGSPKIVLYEANAPNSYTRYEWNLSTGTTFAGGTSFSMQQADIDRDGKNELLIGSNSTTAADLYIVKGVTALDNFSPSNIFRIGRIPPVPEFTYTDEFRGLAVGDIDGNGKTDIFMCNGGRVWRFEYKGSGAITDSANYTATIAYQDRTDGTRLRWVAFTGDVYARAAGLPAGDMSGNGKAELLIANQRGGYADSTSSKIIILESTVAVQQVSSIVGATPDGFELRPNYPNPFNPSTTLSFSIGSRSDVLMTIYSPLGQEIVTLVNQQLAPGSFTVSWNATGLPSGVYFCRLKAGAFEQTQKLILAK